MVETAPQKSRPYSTSFRLSQRGREDLVYLADWRRVSMTDVIEQLIAESAQRVKEVRGQTVTYIDYIPRDDVPAAPESVPEEVEDGAE